MRRRVAVRVAGPRTDLGRRLVANDDEHAGLATTSQPDGATSDHCLGITRGFGDRGDFTRARPDPDSDSNGDIESRAGLAYSESVCNGHRESGRRSLPHAERGVDSYSKPDRHGKSNSIAQRYGKSNRHRDSSRDPDSVANGYSRSCGDCRAITSPSTQPIAATVTAADAVQSTGPYPDSNVNSDGDSNGGANCDGIADRHGAADLDTDDGAHDSDAGGRHRLHLLRRGLEP